ncbi:hypothetical protein D3C87_2169360 [compost metagenome]
MKIETLPSGSRRSVLKRIGVLSMQIDAPLPLKDEVAHMKLDLPTKDEMKSLRGCS